MLYPFLWSHFSSLKEKKNLFFFQIAHALGYLHAKDIVHGRLCSRNVFLESKVQLSVLDYAVGQSNVVYSSPQLLNQINTASEHYYSKLQVI